LLEFASQLRQPRHAVEKFRRARLVIDRQRILRSEPKCGELSARLEKAGGPGRGKTIRNGAKSF